MLIVRAATTQLCHSFQLQGEVTCYDAMIVEAVIVMNLAMTEHAGEWEDFPCTSLEAPASESMHSRSGN